MVAMVLEIVYGGSVNGEGWVGGRAGRQHECACMHVLISCALTYVSLLTYI